MEVPIANADDANLSNEHITNIVNDDDQLDNVEQAIETKMAFVNAHSNHEYEIAATLDAKYQIDAEHDHANTARLHEDPTPQFGVGSLIIAANGAFPAFIPNFNQCIYANNGMNIFVPAKAPRTPNGKKTTTITFTTRSAQTH